MRVPTGVPLVEVIRGDLVESVHQVAACAVTDGGRVVLSIGDVDTPIYLRSAVKPFIAAAIVGSGAADRFGFDQREIAVISASHGGEPYHIEAVESILRKIELDESALQCGAHAPAHEPAALALSRSGVQYRPIHNNCSGKHAGMLAMCRLIGADTSTYLEEVNPLQRSILAFCAQLTGDDVATLTLGVDGCGMPVFATTLRHAALAFARFATLDGIDDQSAGALARVRAAVVAEPAYLSGDGRFDTCLIRATGGQVVGKGGAEGVHGDALLRGGLGLALKVVDAFGARPHRPRSASCVAWAASKPPKRTSFVRLPSLASRTPPAGWWAASPRASCHFRELNGVHNRT